MNIWLLLYFLCLFQIISILMHTEQMSFEVMSSLIFWRGNCTIWSLAQGSPHWTQLALFLVYPPTVRPYINKHYFFLHTHQFCIFKRELHVFCVQETCPVIINKPYCYLKKKQTGRSELLYNCLFILAAAPRALDSSCDTGTRDWQYTVLHCRLLSS